MHEQESSFLTQVGPLVDRRDYSAILLATQEVWPARKCVEFLNSALAEVVRVAAVCLGCIGSTAHVRQLVRLLDHASPAVAVAAEDALWTIWMRGGSSEGNEALGRAIRAIREERFESSLAILNPLCMNEPEFAEAHHQRGIALHSMDRLEEAETAYADAVRSNPYHFAAVAGLGHASAQLGDYEAALRYYRAALVVHPGLTDLREVLPSLEAAVARRVVA